ncbi:MAG: ABC transporter permease [Acidobacteria bacterium]|nr:MAG: ABC transporter permease [Acidobacteriota bacterium]
MQDSRVNRTPWWRGWGSDVRGAWRQHRARPASALAIVAILAVALGLNTALFSMFEAVLIRPLPFRDAGRVVFVWNVISSGALQPMAPARALDFRTRVTAFEHAALIGHMSMTVTGRGPAERWFGASVSSDFFDVLDSPPALGRTFRTNESDRDAVVLSHRLWADQFQSDPAIVGTAIVMNGTRRTVLGVMPADFYWPSITPTTTAESAPLFWTCANPSEVPERPVGTDEDITKNRSMGFLRMVARLRAGRSMESARAEIAGVAAELGRTFPDSDGGRSAGLVGAREQLLGSVEQPMLFVWLASGLLALGACVNVGNLLLVRQAGRRRELAVRSALGASRGRLARQLAAEALVLAGAGGVAGVGLASLGLKVLVLMAPASVGRLGAATIDAGVLGAATLATIATGIVLGGLSAMALWRDRSADDLRTAGAAERGRGRLRQGLVAVQVALTVALLAGAALFGQSLMRLQHVDVGFDVKNLLTFDVMLTGERAEYQAKQLDFFNRVLEAVRAMPGVRAAAGAVTLPIGGDDFGAQVFVEGRPLPPPGEERRIGLQIVGDHWFDTLGMRLIAGRDFVITDTRQSQRVVVINESLARAEWPDASPLGQRLKYGRDADSPIMTVIGVVSDIKHMGPGSPARPEVYLSYGQSSFPMMAIAVRTVGDPLAAVPAIRAAAARVDPTQPISGVNTMAAHLDRAYGRARFLSRLTIAFGGLALLLAVMGVYGVTSFAVAQRTKEFGVRTALGATPSRLMRDVVMKNLAASVLGCVVGVSLAMWGSRMIAAMLFGTAPLEPTAYAAAVLLLLATALCATVAPARRAATIDPVKALRDV